MQHRVFLIAGARPNFMKIAPIWRAMVARGEQFEPLIVHTGQHYDAKMSDIFFQQLEMPEPHIHLGVGSGSHAQQTARVLMAVEEAMIEHQPAMVVVVGDVNSTLAAALAAAKLGIPVAHVEAGLRSFDRTMPEEINRLATDAICDLLLVSEPQGMKNLEAEGIRGDKVHLVGNVMIDSLAHHLPKIREQKTAEQMGYEPRSYALVTMHRPANVDTPEALAKVCEVLEMAAGYARLLFPCHPRTKSRLEQFGLAERVARIDVLEMIEPIGYFEFIDLMQSAKFLLTDSGGIQEESTWLGIPCITLRENTERPLTLTAGTNRLTGLDIEKVRDALAEVAQFDPHQYHAPKIWDGRAAERIAEVLYRFLERGRG